MSTQEAAVLAATEKAAGRDLTDRLDDLAAGEADVVGVAPQRGGGGLGHGTIMRHARLLAQEFLRNKS